MSFSLIVSRWVAFENAAFSGELYVLEKGLYGSPEDWGARNHKISSLQPVFLVNTASYIPLAVSSKMVGDSCMFCIF